MTTCDKGRYRVGPVDFYPSFKKPATAWTTVRYEAIAAADSKAAGVGHPCQGISIDNALWGCRIAESAAMRASLAL